MSDSAKEFLRDWRESFIDPEARTIDEVGATVEELLEDAASDGYSQEEIEAAAGGNLRNYVHLAIRKASEE